MKPKMSDDGKKNGGQVKSAVVGERKVIVVRKRSFRSSSGRQFGVMIRHGLSNRNRSDKGLTLRTAKSHITQCCYTCHTLPSSTSQDVKGTINCFN